MAVKATYSEKKGRKKKKEKKKVARRQIKQSSETVKSKNERTVPEESFLTGALFCKQPHFLLSPRLNKVSGWAEVDYFSIFFISPYSNKS